MRKSLNQGHAGSARKAIAASASDPGQDLPTSVSDLLVNLAHLCDAEGLEFVEILTRAIRHWQVERIDPTSVLEGPVVEIYVGKEGLPSPPRPKRRSKPRKVRVPR